MNILKDKNMDNKLVMSNELIMCRLYKKNIMRRKIRAPTRFLIILIKTLNKNIEFCKVIFRKGSLLIKISKLKKWEVLI
jgi:hypothetical protein